MAAAAIPALGRILGMMVGSGATGRLNPAAGRAGLPVAMPVQSGLEKAMSGLQTAGNMVYSVQAVTGAAKSLGNSLVTLLSPTLLASKAFDAIPGIFSKILNAVSPLSVLNSAVGALAGVAAIAVEHVTALGKSVKPFVDLYNPAEGQQFEFAERDLIASFGKAFVPILQFATQVVRGFADIVFRLAGPFATLGKAFAPIGEQIPRFVNAITPLLDLIGKGVEMFAALGKPFADLLAIGMELVSGALFDSFKSLTELFGPFIKVVTDAAKALGQLTGAFLRTLRSRRPELTTGAAGGSRGAAVTNANLGSVEAFIAQAWKNAFMHSSRGTPEERAAMSLEEIRQALDRLIEMIERSIPNISGPAHSLGLGLRPPGPEGGRREEMNWQDELREGITHGDPAEILDPFRRRAHGLGTVLG